MDELDKIIKMLEKKMPVGTIQLGVEFKDIDKVPFSSCRLNYMLHGGIPEGRLAEFSGSDGSGKTTTALDLVGQCQRKYPDKKVIFCDIESTFDPAWAIKMGVDIDSIILYRPDSQGAEEVFQYLLDLMDTGDASMVVLDSLGAMVSDLANEKSIGEKTYGGISQSLTTFSKKAVPICARTGCIFLGINQVRDDMNSMYGGTVTTGGRGWRHNCSTRLSFRHGNFLDDKGNNLSRSCENPAGHQVMVSLVKSKVCPPDRKVGFYTLNYQSGIDYISDTFDVAVNLKLINKAGAWFTFLDQDGVVKTMQDQEGNEIDMKFHGKPKAVEYLRQSESDYDILVKLVKENMEKTIVIG